MGAAYLANGALNFFWSLLFFGRRRPDRALVEVAALWISIAVMIAAVARLRPDAAWLLAPYLAWVTFAAALTLTVWRLNPTRL